ncbi:synaptophysin-like protein 1 [Hipposideros larvatus]
MASNMYLFRQRISRLGQVRPWKAPPLLSPCSPLTSRGHPSLSPPQCCASGSTAAAPPRGLPGPPPAARPSCPSTPLGCTVWSVPLCLRPAVLIVSPSFPQRMSSFQLNLNPLKEPLGFIKVLEWIASIFAFATCGGFRGNTEILVSCPKSHENKTITASFGYPFRLNQASFKALPDVNVCGIDWKTQVLIGDYSSSAQFYVTFAVFVFLYCIAALLLYVGYTNLYRDNRKLPMVDFVVTLVVTFLWLVSTSAWAKALTDIKVATGHNIVQELGPCKQGVTCSFVSVTSMGSLNVSVIFGFLNMILWGGNAWFVYKETSLHSPSNTSASHTQGGLPPPTGM